MRILFISKSDLIGGAAVAASRQMEALNKAGVETQMLVHDKLGDSPNTISIGNRLANRIAFLKERLCIALHNGFDRKLLFNVSIANSGSSICDREEFRKADLIHLHWTQQGMLSLHEIKRILSSGKPIVWTMHDMWLCTGICHHAEGCSKFKDQCGKCPFLHSQNEKDLSNKVYRQKEKIFKNYDFTVVTVSKWLSLQARSSRLIGDKNIKIIPNLVSLDQFRMMNKKESRVALNIPVTKKIMVMGAARLDAHIKGFDLLIKALRSLCNTRPELTIQLHIVFFGHFKAGTEQLSELPISYTYLGTVADKTLQSQIYSASDCVVVPSRYETFGQTLIEAMACGAVPVTFNNSGQIDIVNHLSNGYLAQAFDVEDFAQGIAWAVDVAQDESIPSLQRLYVKGKYSESIVAEQLIDTYKIEIDQKRRH